LASSLRSGRGRGQDDRFGRSVVPTFPLLNEFGRLQFVEQPNNERSATILSSCNAAEPK
jgi:hypothetical protein